MAVCDACEKLNNQPKGAPGHDALVETRSINMSRASMGQASGFLTHYRCSACGTLMSHDGDTKDPHAGWYISKRG